ncbi:MAG: DUF2130 domain-containing protein, partial [Candidatus Yonathbacteria bacterium]|nr:DUF2130 domain-containing protein [Candidatus Yonathbacteria bacterium]
ILHRVHASSGISCGTIAWELKRVKTWNDGWIVKLKEDQRAIGAELGVIVTDVLPKDIERFGLKDGIWVSDYASYRGLAEALRVQLIRTESAKQIAVNQAEKQSVLYAYVTSTAFTHRVQAIAEAFIGMQDDMHKEKRAVQKRWAQQEKRIEQVILNTTGMYGDLTGLLGPAMQTITQLEEGDSSVEMIATTEETVSESITQ